MPIIPMVRFAIVCLSAAALSAVFLGRPVSAEEAPSSQLIDCGSDKVVLFHNTPHSPDGRYAMGWTLRRRDPKAKAVDWSKFDFEKPYDFLDQYDYSDPNFIGSGLAPLLDAMKSAPTPSPGGGAPYEVLDCIVDLKRKNLLPLPSDAPYTPHLNHRDFSVIWKDSRALVVNEARFFTLNVWLVALGDEAMRQKDLSQAINSEAERIIKAKRALNYDRYAISWSPVLAKSKTAFSKHSVQLNFLAAIPKSLTDDDFEGRVSVDYGTGKVIGSVCDAPRDNPFIDNVQLAKADRLLNKTYRELIAKLSAAGRAKLLEEQLAWLDQRNSDCLYDKEGEENSIETRNEALIKSTKKRAAELKERLNSL